VESEKWKEIAPVL